MALELHLAASRSPSIVTFSVSFDEGLAILPVVDRDEGVAIHLSPFFGLLIQFPPVLGLCRGTDVHDWSISSRLSLVAWPLFAQVLGRYNTWIL